MNILHSRIVAVSLLFLSCAGFSSHAQSAAAGGGGGASGGSSGGSSASGASGGSGGGSGSSLQSESKVLIFQSLSECVGDLVEKMRHSASAGNDTKKPAFVLNLPFLPDDAASCWEFKRQLLALDTKLNDFQTAYVAQQASQLVTPYEIMYSGYTADFTRVEGDFNTMNANYNAKLGGTSATASTGGGTSASALPDIKELGGAGASASQIGIIASTISGLLTLAESFHSTFSTTQGALGLDQPTVNSLVVNELINRGYRVYDFSQFYTGEDTPKPFDPKLPVEKQSVMDLADALDKEVDRLDQDGIPLPDLSSQNNKGTLSGQLKIIYESLDHLKANLANLQDRSNKNQLNGKDPSGAPLTHLSVDDQTKLTRDVKTIQDDQDALQKTDWSVEYKTYTTALASRNKVLAAVLKAASTFQQVIQGAIAPKYALASSSGGGDGSGDSKGNTFTFTLPDGSKLAATFSGGSDTSTTGSSGDKSQGGGQSSAAPQASPINYIEKFAVLDHNLNLMRDQNIKLIAAHVIVGDTTQTHVSRQILEDYVALSNRAVVELQVFDPSQGQYVYSDHSESDHQYVYFPSRVRDGAENKWKDRDTLTHYWREEPYNDLEWFSRSDWALREAAATHHPILIYYSGNSELAPLSHGPDERVFADEDFKTYAAKNFVLLRVDAASPEDPKISLLMKAAGVSSKRDSPALVLVSHDGSMAKAVNYAVDKDTDVDALIDAIQDKADEVK